MGQEAEALAAVPTAIAITLGYDLSRPAPRTEHVLPKELAPEELPNFGFRRNLTKGVHTSHDTRYVTTGSYCPCYGWLIVDEAS